MEAAANGLTTLSPPTRLASLAGPFPPTTSGGQTRTAYSPRWSPQRRNTGQSPATPQHGSVPRNPATRVSPPQRRNTGHSPPPQHGSVPRNPATRVSPPQPRNTGQSPATPQHGSVPPASPGGRSLRWNAVEAEVGGQPRNTHPDSPLTRCASPAGHLPGWGDSLRAPTASRAQPAMVIPRPAWAHAGTPKDLRGRSR